MLNDSRVRQRELRDPHAAPLTATAPLESPSPSVTVIVPAFNEESGIRDTLDALARQTQPPAQIIVVDDCSTDRTAEVAREYEVSVLRTPANLGSKARAQNYALPHCDTDLVLPVDADTVLADDYVERIVRPFADPDVVVAAGAVQTKITRTLTERGRSIEYLFGFHYYRPVQQLANSVVVCSGCCSAFRRETLVAFGGFPERTIVEDMDYTWSQQIMGMKAVYVSGAVAWAADPASVKFLRKQVWRWMSGFFQNVRIHWRDLLRRKRMLALWIALALVEICMAPIWWISPVLLPLVFHMSFVGVMSWWFGLETAMLLPPLLYACVRRRLNPARVLFNIPCVYFNKAFNTYYAWKALIVELVLVPLGLSNGLVIYEKGR
ncbi:MAG TPA: glycosyltransferase family 2 protein [Streptosporangiaceae bacterium]|nr:glycosyltransferase family 2 protein [Streptosporangiaceae bacterium]